MQPSTAKSEDRRQSQRAGIAIAVLSRTGCVMRLCQATNISADGIFVACVNEDDSTLPSNAKCWIEFSLPGSDVKIAARARVVRSAVRTRFLLCAMRFATIAPSHKRMILSYVAGPHTALPAPPSPYLALASQE